MLGTLGIPDLLLAGGYLLDSFEDFLASTCATLQHVLTAEFSRRQHGCNIAPAAEKPQFDKIAPTSVESPNTKSLSAQQPVLQNVSITESAESAEPLRASSGVSAEETAIKRKASSVMGFSDKGVEQEFTGWNAPAKRLACSLSGNIYMNIP